MPTWRRWQRVKTTGGWCELCPADNSAREPTRKEREDHISAVDCCYWGRVQTRQACLGSMAMISWHLLLSGHMGYLPHLNLILRVLNWVPSTLETDSTLSVPLISLVSSTQGHMTQAPRSHAQEAFKPSVALPLTMWGYITAFAPRL